MGGRGTFALGNNVPYTYSTIEKIEGVKVLKGLEGHHSLPMESHSSKMYIKLDHNGMFKELRVYGDDKRVAFEIAYHTEKSLDPKNKKVLHYHTYKYGSDFKGGMYRSPATLLSEKMKKQFQKYFKGLEL